MPRLSVWDSGRKSHDYKFMDRTISEWFGTGVAIYVHLYTGPQQDIEPLNTDISSATYTLPTPTNTLPPSNVTQIQDVLLLENRDRNYSQTVYELRGVYTKSNGGFDLRQFAIFEGVDNFSIDFHYNDMIAILGRKLMAGDVLEFPNERDQYLLNGQPAINKFYVVQDADAPGEGYSATWYYHIWRCQLALMTNSQEYQDILSAQAYNPLGQSQGATIGDLMSTMATEMGINQQIWDAAVSQVPERYFETQQFWIVPGTETGSEYPWVFAGDGIPPNGAALAGQGISYPESPTTGEYFLRTDFIPPTLFQWTGAAWIMQEVDWRQTWSVCHRLMESFINDTAIRTNDDGTTGMERTALSQAVSPQADF